jgi:hypothetical protein
MATSVSVSVVAEPRKIKLKKILSKKPVVEVILPVEAQKPEKSIWMYMRRAPKEKAEPMVWEGIEDISDDENDTPQAAGKRLSMMKATRDKMQQRYYKERLDQFQAAGLFLKWQPVKLLKTHSNYDYEVVSTPAYPIKRDM